jgi:capsular polysaccharide biosynthesis protein
VALRSPKTSQGAPARQSGPAEPPRKRGRGWVVTRTLLVILILTVAGALIAVGVVEGKGVQYRAGIDVRSATADATCVYFDCPQPVPTPQGNPYVLDQVNAILSPAMASIVHKNVPTVTTSQLLANVCAKEIGQSATIHICYQTANKGDATTVANAYAHAYVNWSNGRAVTSLSALIGSMNYTLGQMPSLQRAGARGQALAQQIDVVSQAKTAFSNNDGPNGAKIFGNDLSAQQVQTVRSTPSTAKAGAIGAAAGLVLAIGLLLILPPLIRRPGSGDGSDDGRTAASEESLDLFTAPVDEPVR